MFAMPKKEGGTTPISDPHCQTAKGNQRIAIGLLSKLIIREDRCKSAKYPCEKCPRHIMQGLVNIHSKSTSAIGTPIFKPHDSGLRALAKHKGQLKI